MQILPARCRSKYASKGQLHIAMLGHKRVPSREGGVEVVVEELSTRMVKLGHKVTLYNRKGHHVAGEEFDLKQKGSYKGVRLKYVPTINKRGYAAVTSSFFGAIMAAFGPYDIVHFHAEGPCAALWIPKLFGKRCIATVHGLDHQRQKWGSFASKFILFGEKTAVRFADEIIVLSRNVQEYFKKTYGRDTVYIPNGVSRPVTLNPDLISRKYGLSKDEYFMFLGRLVPEKGVEYLIKAFKELDTELKLVIAGSGSDTDKYVERLKKLARDDDRIIFSGFVQGRELAELYSNAYTYVLPSDLEGMPLTLLEALSYGNCCLVSDIAECVEVAGEKALTFKKSDVSDLKNKLDYLVRNPEKVQKMRSGAATYICEKYKWDTVTEKTLELYRGIGNNHENSYC